MKMQEMMIHFRFMNDFAYLQVYTNKNYSFFSVLTLHKNFLDWGLRVVRNMKAREPDCEEKSQNARKEKSEWERRKE